MRIRSLHPRYLDSKGLVALRRETLLAKHVLLGKTKGYKNHPQLNRFKETVHPVHMIDYYLSIVYEEATARGYTFSKEKIDRTFMPATLTVTQGQIMYEREHLLKKLQVRDEERYTLFSKEKSIEQHPMFVVVEGEIETWEIV